MLYDGLYDGRYAMHITTGGPDAEWARPEHSEGSGPNIDIKYYLINKLKKTTG
jgi:hypothetical protein